MVAYGARARLSGMPSPAITAIVVLCLAAVAVSQPTAAQEAPGPHRPEPRLPAVVDKSAGVAKPAVNDNRTIDPETQGQPERKPAFSTPAAHNDVFGGSPSDTRADGAPARSAGAEASRSEASRSQGKAAGVPASSLPRDLSPWQMFMSADIVVKAVMIGLAFASLVT